MDLDLPGVSLQRVHNPIFRKDRHLSSALITTEIDYMFENAQNLKALKREHKELLAKLETTRATPLDSKGFLGWGMSRLHHLAHTKNANQELNQILRAACEATRVATLDYYGKPVIKSCPLTPLIIDFYNAKCNFNQLIRDITFSTEFHQEYTIGSVRGDVYGNLHLVWAKHNSCYVVTHSHIVALRDIINSWFSVLIYAQLERTKYPGFDLYEEVEAIWAAGSALVLSKPVQAYELIKLWPSLVIGSILRDQENKPSFIAALTSENQHHAETQLFKIQTRTVTTQFMAMMQLELAGLWKCFGHPNIDMDKSTKAWVDKGTVMRADVRVMAPLLAWAFRLEFCRQYYRDKHKWPEVEVLPTAPNFIQHSYHNNLWTEKPDVPWRPEDFQDVRLRHTLTFDYHVDTSDLISDKSIIPARDQWIHEYDKQAHKTKYGYFPRGPPPTSKSVVIDYLERETIDVKSIIETISTRQVPDQWKVIMTVAKEREFKPEKARFYAKMVPEMRLYQTATESNLAKHIFPHIKHQSMTMSEEQLTRTILKMNSPTLKMREETYVFIVVDFSSWCTTFRWDLMWDLFKEIDQLFGLENVYTYTHMFPLESVLLFQDRFCPPQQDKDSGNPMNGPRCYGGPEAWQEGLRQKGWTLATILLILLASGTCGTSASLLGQGDNQVILLRIPPRRRLETLKMDQEGYITMFLTTLKQYCERAGIIIKLEETWYSRDTFEYARRYYYKGAQVSGALKRIARLSSEANQTIPSVNGDVAGIFSTGATAAGEDPTPVSAYYCTIVEAAILLRDTNPWLRTSDLADTVSLTMISRTIGGYPVTLYSQFCSRAVQDVLTSNLRLVQTALRDPFLSSSIARLACLRISKHVDYKSLIQDPQSLPLDIPRQPENLVRQEVKKGLESIVRNKAVKALFDRDSTVAEQKLIQDLMAIQPCNPKLLNKLYSLSNVGLQEKWLAKFASTRSIQKVAMSSWSDEQDVMNSIKTMELRYSRYLETKAPDPNVKELSTVACITTYAQRLREEAWGIRIEGITMPPQQEQVIVKPWKDLLDSEMGRAILITTGPRGPLPRDLTKGPYQAYFGSSTRLRARKAPLQVIEVGSTVSSLKQLMELRGWVKGSDQLKALIDKMVQEKTDISLDKLQQYVRDVYSGCLAHRLPCPALHQSGMANMNLNMASHYVFTSDTAHEYAKGGVNYTICYQSVFLYALTVLFTLEREHMLYLPEQMAAVFSCPSCTWILPPDSFTLEEITYPGLELGSKITELHHKDEHAVYRLPQTVDVAWSYAVHMARKFAAWIINRKLTTHITSLENVSLDETVTASFVNLAEFSRLAVPQFIRAYVFYCTLYDPSFYGDTASFFDEVLTGPDKTPYDVLLDSLVKCKLLGPLTDYAQVPPRTHYSRMALRQVLYLVLTRAQSEMREILDTNYIITPEDHLPVVIRAMQVKMYHMKIPCLLSTSMTGDKIDQMLHEMSRSQRHALRPRVTPSEEETIAWVRAQPRGNYFTPHLLPVIMRPRTEPLTGAIASTSSYIHLTATVGGSVYATAAHELSMNARFRDWLGEPRRLITTNDKGGLVYAALMHTELFESGYPHWRREPLELVNDQEPTAVIVDRCGLPYDTALYVKQAPLDSPILDGEVAVVVGCNQLIVPVKGVTCLGLIKTPCRVPGQVLEIFHTHTRPSPAHVWIAYQSGPDTPVTEIFNMSLAGKHWSTALNFVKEDLIECIQEDVCLSPFSEVGHALGSVPASVESLREALRTRLRQARSLITELRCKGYRTSASYEAHVAQHRSDQSRMTHYRRLTYLLIIVTLFNTKEWGATGVRGVVKYHWHGRALCFKRCPSIRSTVTVRLDTLESVKFALPSWVMYLWALSSTEPGARLKLRGPTISFV
ncbi:RNA-dependent RNA polymerase [Hymenopteran orino-related virus OKIAV87]|uniref:RNA-directed RNA polymerase n=1 Tax=Hymenopteran orino-related virus OKIAV87 TaxID=2746371 RepID=A0A7D7F1B6_9MONO|nr:RNA-dependent RNA polymerase [Hymenopteran orino-related virus OKIAV87]QMP82162.1 RNA-dependent RNA polymerase [Hymenopteran orino-related virus OKIAV87]